jgi:hypothetical protein
MKKNEEDEKRINEKNVYQLDFSKYQQFIDEAVYVPNIEIEKFKLVGLNCSQC